MEATDQALQPAVLAHYARVGSLLEASFAGAPIVYANFPNGFGQPAHYGVTDVPLSESKLLWECHSHYAIEFHGWAPLIGSPHRLRFARVLIEAEGRPFDDVKEAALAVRAGLFDAGIECVPIIDGTNGIALWAPLADAPVDATVRTWLHARCAEIVARHPDLLSGEANTHHDGRVHLHVSSNAAGRYSALPYSLRGDARLSMCTPIAWEELGAVGATACDAAGAAARIAAHGDVFADQVAIIAHQKLADARGYAE